MGVQATVLIPTHDHGRLLEHAAASALRQTVSEIEIFVIGDGVDEVTRQTALELVEADARVRFFDNPKGPRHGEIHRHQALQEATGRIVCYLSDDDLWLPEHVATMLDLLDEADFAHAVPLGIRPEGSMHLWVGDLNVPASRARVAGLTNFIPLSCGAHTLELYRRLPDGWRTTPADVATDVYMWSQLLSAPGCAAISGGRVTVLHFPSPWRKSMTIEQRLEELEYWTSLTDTPGFETELSGKVIAQINQHRTTVDQELREQKLRASTLERASKVTDAKIVELEKELSGARAELHSGREELSRARADLAEATSSIEDLAARYQDLTTRHEELTSRHESVDRQVTELEEELKVSRAREDRLTRERDLVTGSLTWRIRNRLLRVPGVAALVRRVGGARARRAGT